MLNKAKAIVLSKIKYRDNDLIVKCFTNHRGAVSYLVRGVLKTSKRNSKAAYFQLLTQLEIEENFKENQTLQTIRDIKLNYPYATLHTNVLKSSIVIFLSEVLNSVLKEEEQNEQLYSYLETTFQWLDIKDQFANFHLLFLLNLTKHLGFFPEISNSEVNFFNLSKGAFEPQKSDLYSISGENLIILKQLLGTNFDDLEQIKLTSKQRQSFLTMLLLYFELHLGSFRKTK